MGQERISVKTENKSLDLVLESLAATYQLQFAFDAGHFSQIKVTMNADNLTMDEFLNELCDKYHLLYEKIDQTFVLYKNPAPLPEKKKEPVSFAGLVVDRSSGEPLLFCAVGFGENKGTITNESGIFSEMIEETEQVKIWISHLGYQRLDTVLQLNKNTFHKLSLVPFAVHIETINVFGQEKNMIEMGSQPEKVAFNPKQSENLPRIDDSDLVTALGLIPGVNFQGGATPGISIRGGSPSENLVLLDGMPVLETSHLFGNMSVLNAKFISQAFVSRGAFDATYGERTSGIVELVGKKNYYQPSLDLSANLLNVNAVGEVPLGKVVSVSAAYRKSYADQWENYIYKRILAQSVISEEDEGSVFPTVRFDDLNLKLSVKPSDKQEISVNAFQSNDLQNKDFIFKENSRFFREEEADSENRGISGNWKFRIGQNWQHHLNVGYNELYRNSWSLAGMGPNSQGKGGKEELDSDANSLKEVIMNWSGSLKTGIFTHEFGMGANIDQVFYLYLAERSTGNIQVDSINYDSEIAILHAYFQEKIRLSEKLHIRAGLRVNREDITNQFYFQPRAGITFHISPSADVFYAAGIYNQFLSRIRKIDSNGKADLVWMLPDENGLGVLKAQQHVLGIRFEKNGFAIDLESYYKKTTGRLNLFAEVSGKKEKFIEYVPHPGESENYGIDAMFHYKQGIFTHMLAYSLSKSTEQFEVFNGGESYPSFDDQPHRLRWTEMARYKNWVWATNVTYYSGGPYLMAEGDGAPSEFGRLPYFAQADFSMIKRFNYKFFTMSAGVSLLNIFDRRNVLGVDYYHISDNTGSYSVRTDITAMRFTPVFFLNLKFQ